MGNAEFWAGPFGNDYLDRNRVDWRARVPFWRDIIDRTGARSVYEVGCNAGWNLSAIRRAFPDVVVAGCDVNEKAIIQAQAAGLRHALCGEIDPNNIDRGQSSELVFTAGVLIHIAPDELPGLMQKIVRTSARYVLAVEYAADKEEEVEYRGHAGKLWRRPFGALYEALGMRLVQHGLAGQGFDSCDYWLCEKPQ